MRPLLLAVLLWAPSARAGVDLESAFAELSPKAAAAKEKKRRVFPLLVSPARPEEFAAPLVLDAPLPALRDGLLSAVSVEIGGRAWKVGLTGDSGWDDFYLVLTSGADRLLAPLAPLGRFLDSGGVVVSDEDGPVLRFNARISLLHPINGTTVLAVDASGAGRDSFTVGELIDAMKAKGKAGRLGGDEILAFALTEAADDGKSLSGERTVVLVKPSGAKTRAYSIRESELEPGRPLRAAAYGRILILLKTTDDRLVVRDAGPAPKN